MKKIILSFFIFLISYYSLSFSFFITTKGSSDVLPPKGIQESIEKNNIVVEKPNKNNLNIYSKRAIIFERNSGIILYEKNINEVCPMASTTKIMTAILVLENTNLNDIVTISENAAKTRGSRLGLHTGDKITVKDLLYGLMLPSGNDAAYALAEYTFGSFDTFITMMNKKAKSLGLLNTSFESPHGLDSKNHYTTVYELAKITDYALNNEIFKTIILTKKYTVYINSHPKTITNTNELLGNKYVYGVKTGFTGNAGRCLVTAANNNDLDIIVIVLGADTKSIRTSDSKKLLNYAFENYTLLNLSPFILEEFNNIKNIKIKNLKIEKSFNQNLNIFLKNYSSNRKIYYPILKKGNSIVTTNSNDTYNIKAPIYKNSPIYIIDLYINQKHILSYEVLSSENIYKTNSISYFLYFFKNFKKIINNLYF